MGAFMTWIKLTDPAGNAVQLSVEQLVLVRKPATGEVDERAKAVLDLSNGHLQAVRETPEDVMGRLPK
jgi:hypothetical protein